MTNTSDFSDDLFLTKNWAGWSKLQVQQQRGLRQLPGAAVARQSEREAEREGLRDGGAHQCELIMINDEALGNVVKQYKRPDMNGDLRLGFAERSGLTSPACCGGCVRASRPGWTRWKPGRPSGGRRTSRKKTEKSGPFPKGPD